MTEDHPTSHPEQARLPDFALDVASWFVATAGLVVDELTPAHLRGHLDLGPQHHTPWGIVHGGVYCTAVESAASIGGSAAVADRGQYAVGVHNATDLIRPVRGGRADVTAHLIHLGRTQQLWNITITNEGDKLLARGHVRLHNVELGHGTP